MKKLLVLSLIVGLTLGGCSWKVCTKATTDGIAKATTVLEAIQTYYDPLVSLATLTGVGTIPSVTIKAVMTLTDTALKGLGTIIATRCADDTTLTLATLALAEIKALFGTKEVKALMATKGIKAPK